MEENTEEQKRIYSMKSTLKQIEQINDLPVPNAHILRLIKDLQNEDIDWKKLISDIEQDVSLVATLLKLVNSGYYGLRSTVDSVAAAIKLLGLMQVRQAIYSATVMEVFKPEEKEEWEHAYSCFTLMNTLMESCSLPAANNLPLTMLMHDIGKVALRRFSPKKYDLVYEVAKNEGITHIAAERQLLKVDHAEVGAWLL
jgi:HD-like signal output (HDOD) protein